MEHFDVYFPNEPDASAKDIMVSCKEYSRGRGGGTYWHGLVIAVNYDHADMPGNKRDPSDPQAQALFHKPHPHGGDDIPVAVFGIGRVRDEKGLYVLESKKNLSSIGGS